MILRIRDANGKVQEILVIKGDKGDKGEPGEDYIFTEADKTEIANIVLQNFTDVAVIGQ